MLGLLGPVPITDFERASIHQFTDCHPGLAPSSTGQKERISQLQGSSSYPLVGGKLVIESAQEPADRPLFSDIWKLELNRPLRGETYVWSHVGLPFEHLELPHKIGRDHRVAKKSLIKYTVIQ